MRPFCFDHVFRAPSVAAVFDAYFDPQHQQEQDDALGIVERTVLERFEDSDVLRRVCRVVPRRQLPGILTPFVDGGVLAYHETAIWRRRDRAGERSGAAGPRSNAERGGSIDIEIRPTLRGGRSVIRGVYALDPAPDGIHRRYAGEVRVELPLIGGRVERGIVTELATSVPAAAEVTQRWLDRGVAAMSALA
jgi:hypothetical protein